MSRFRWGIFGTGAVSAKFVAGLAAARGAEAAFVASRSRGRAEAFAAAVGIQQAIEGYAEAAATGGVDAVYVATPPSMHVQHAAYCLEAGLPVLVEKPFAVTAAEATRLAELARSKAVFAMEAMWTRFLPAAQALRERIAAGDIGAVRFVAGNFGTSQTPDRTNGLFDPALGGGAISHLGAYPISLGQWLFGAPVEMQTIGHIGASGVDEDAAFQLLYPQGAIGSFFTTLRAWAPDDFQVLGERGMVEFRGSIVRPHGLNVFREGPRGVEAPQLGWRGRLRQHGLVHQVAQRVGRSSRASGAGVNHYYAGNGYQYEADEVRACIQKGLVESRTMPLSDSIASVRTADSIRREIHAQALRGSETG